MGTLDFSGTFDTTNAMSAMFLWIVFGFLASIINCDLQRIIAKNPIVIHLFGFTAFFFLFTMLDSNNKTSIEVVWFKSFFVYVLFVLMTKARWYFVLAVLALLLVDQSIKKDIAFEKAGGKDVSVKEDRQRIVSQWVNKLIMVLIAVGVIHYAWRQRSKYGKNFNWFQFFFGVSKCRYYAADPR